jgi:hypothetical protein
MDSYLGYDYSQLPLPGIAKHHLVPNPQIYWIRKGRPLAYTDAPLQWAQAQCGILNNGCYEIIVKNIPASRLGLSKESIVAGPDPFPPGPSSDISMDRYHGIATTIATSLRSPSPMSLKKS